MKYHINADVWGYLDLRNFSQNFSSSAADNLSLTAYGDTQSLNCDFKIEEYVWKNQYNSWFPRMICHNLLYSFELLIGRFPEKPDILTQS